MLSEDMKRVVRQQRLGFVASVCPDGTPNLSPKGTTAVWDDDHLVFAHIHSQQTVANIEAGRSIVEMNVVDPIVRKGYRFKGTATVHRAGQVYEAGSAVLQRTQRARNATESRQSCSSRVEHAAALTSPAYDDGSTEAVVEERSLNMYGLERAAASDGTGERPRCAGRESETPR